MRRSVSGTRHRAKNDGTENLRCHRQHSANIHRVFGGTRTNGPRPEKIAKQAYAHCQELAKGVEESHPLQAQVTGVMGELEELMA